MALFIDLGMLELSYRQGCTISRRGGMKFYKKKNWGMKFKGKRRKSRKERRKRERKREKGKNLRACLKFL